MASLKIACPLVIQEIPKAIKAIVSNQNTGFRLTILGKLVNHNIYTVIVIMQPSIVNPQV